MRAGLALLSLLFCVLIGVYIWSISAKSASVQEQPGGAVDQARQLSGHAADGTNALDSIKTDGVNTGSGQLKAILVTDVTPDGAMEKYYGLKKGDKITVEGQYDVQNSDADMANKMLLEAYKASAPLMIIRDGKEMTLPLPATNATAVTPIAPISPEKTAAAAPAAVPGNNGSSAAAPQGPRSQRQVINSQIDQIRSRPEGEGQ